MTVYHGPWVWDTSVPSRPFWRGPAGSLGCLDVRSYAQHAAPADGGGGGAFFDLASDPGAGYLSLGDGPLDPVGSVKRAVMSNRLGVAVTAPSLGGILKEVLSSLADPTGTDRWKPVVPGAGRVARICVGNFRLAQQADEDDPIWLAARAVLRLEYARVRALVLAGLLPEGTHLRHLGRWLLRYLTSDYSQFLGGLPDEGALEPQTSASDAFTRSDNTDLNAGGGAGWTEADLSSGDYEIKSNRLHANAVGGDNNVCRLTSWAGTADYYTQAIQNLASGSWTFHGVGVRHALNGSNHDWYMMLGDGSFTDIYKRVAASYTQLSHVAATLNTATDYTWKLKASGSTLQQFLNGSQQGTDLTDTALSAAGEPCLRGYGNNDVSFDDFLADDGAVSISYEQEGSRFRADDGSESGASWLAAQDLDVFRERVTNTRLRLLVNATGDPPARKFKLQYRNITDTPWKDVT